MIKRILASAVLICGVSLAPAQESADTEAPIAADDAEIAPSHESAAPSAPAGVQPGGPAAPRARSAQSSASPSQPANAPAEAPPPSAPAPAGGAPTGCSGKWGDGEHFETAAQCLAVVNADNARNKNLNQACADKSRANDGGPCVKIVSPGDGLYNFWDCVYGPSTTFPGGPEIIIPDGKTFTGAIWARKVSGVPAQPPAYGTDLSAGAPWWDVCTGKAPSASVATPGRCDPVRQPSPHWGAKDGLCLPSCGKAGGRSSYADPCENHGKVSAGTAYDVAYCCK